MAVPYGRLLTDRRVLVWVSAYAASRLPVAMTPLALLFFAKDRTGSYGAGALMAAIFTIAEAAAAPILGTRLDRGAMRTELALGLLISAIAYATLLATTSAPIGIPMVLAVVAGAAPAGAPGGLRALLTRILDEDQVAAGLSLESALNQAVWAAAPAVVAALAVGVFPAACFAIAAAAALSSAIILWRLQPARMPRSVPHSSRPLLGTLWAAWPIYLTSAAAMFLLATVELSLPALLGERDIAAGWAGPLLTGFSIASIVGGLCYGVRGWPGGFRRQSLVLLLVVAIMIILVSAAPNLAGISTALLFAGIFQTPLLTTRNLSLRDRLPPHVHSAGYSVMYAGSGVGYATGGTVTSAMLSFGPASESIFAGALVALALALACSVAERRATGGLIGKG